MEATALIYLTLYLLAAFIGLSVTLYTWRRRTVNGAAQYSLFAFNQVAWILFFIVELLSYKKETKIFWDQLQWINTVLLPVTLAWFTIHYVGIELPRKRLFWAAMLAFPFLFVLLVFSNPWHGLVWEVAWVRIGDPFSDLVYDFTPLDEIMIGYSYIIGSLSVALLAIHMWNMPSPARRQAVLIILGLAAPYLGGLFILAGVQIGPFRDMMPFTFAISNLLALAGLYRLRLFDIAPVVRDVVIDELRDEVLVVDPRERLVYLNRAAMHRLGLPAGAVFGRSIDDVYRDWPGLVEQLKDPGESDAFTVKIPTGEVVAYQLRTSLLHDPWGRPAGRVILMNDVTRLKAAEDELRQHRQYLSQLVEQRTAELTSALNTLQHNADVLEQRVAERTAELAAQNRELETFAYSVSHDLKAPLRGIDGYSRLLLEEYGPLLDEEGRRFLDNIRLAAAQMYQLIEDLLAYSRFQRRTFSYQQVDLCTLTQAVLAEYAGEIDRRHIRLLTDLQCQDVYVEVEGLAQALRNLGDNAIKFTRDVAEPCIEVGSRLTQDGCLLWVRDNGIGFDMGYQDRIFEIFQRLHRSEDYPGTGIGLALVQKAAQRMGGRAWAESAPGFGATFYFLLPQRAEDGEKLASSAG